MTNESVQTFLYMIKPSRPEMLTEAPTQAEQEIIDEHFAYLSDAAAQGIVLLAGRTDMLPPDAFGIVIFFAEDADAAGRFVENDPAVAGKVMQARLYPFRLPVTGFPKK